MNDAWRRWAEGMLDAVLERVDGLDAELSAAMVKLKGPNVRVRPGRKMRSPGAAGRR